MTGLRKQFRGCLPGTAPGVSATGPDLLADLEGREVIEHAAGALPQAVRECGGGRDG